MAKIYFNLIINGRKTIDDVPARLRDAVQALLDEYYKEHPEPDT